MRVDLRDAAGLAHRLVGGGADPDLVDLDWRPLAGDLLPDWYDEWLLLERERYRLLGLQALEALAERLLAAGRPRHALEVALTAVARDPLRESAHRIVVELQLAEGNLPEAIRQYERYGQLVGRFGLAPSRRMDELVRGLVPPGTGRLLLGI